jgi:long-subunit fatty acid transport protein
MTRSIIAVAALLGSTSIAAAGGIDRSGQSIVALFETGRYMEFSLGYASPDTSGTGNVLLGGGNSGNATGDFFSFGAAYKSDLNNQLSYAIIYDQPFGADIDYPVGTGYFAQGAITGLLRYKLPSNVSFHGGLRVQTVEASANIPFVSSGPGLGIANPGAPYVVNGDRDVGLGYVLGVAYERPDIALRVSLTYNSKIKHSLDTTETSALASPTNSETEFETPQSVNLEFQTGIAKDTLLFGGLRWTEWSQFTITPVDYQTLTGVPLVSFEDDRYTWTLGVGRRLNDTWSVAATAGYERSTGSPTSNLGPTDGFKSLALAAIYTKDKIKVTTGIRYINIGDADTRVGALVPGGSFRDNDAVAIGVKVGYSF